MHHVSCSPSKIPYVGFSPVRLQTGIQLRPSLTPPRFKYEAYMHPGNANLYATKAENLCSCGPEGHVGGTSYLSAIQSRGPWLAFAFCCRNGSSLNMPSSETLHPYLCLISFVHSYFALRPRMGWHGEVPQFNPHIFHIVPSSVPRRLQQVHMVVASLLMIAFTTPVLVRQSQVHARRFSRGRVTRLQSSLYATARCFASPSPARTFTSELSPDRSP